MNKDEFSRVFIFLIHSSGCSEPTRPETGTDGFKLGKNPVYQTRKFKLENFKNQLQIDKGTGLQLFGNPFSRMKKRDFLGVINLVITA